ncbi:hypothetical protein ILUMI_23919 [Ignelater luminosus]|uniref:Uncharacterized protein n=1 Tax=Ignelater luminosus TaxID=2038154 RepID=A0A8K0CBI9_IGNLU|nr:hypothetical protein ILUMI_23919 [Ignelater luminosus]
MEIRKAKFLNQLAETNREKIEKETQLQKESPRWFVERRKRLTASKFGRICKLENKTPRGAAGNSREPLAIEEVDRKLRVEIKRSGLIIEKDFRFLGASPTVII